MPNSLGGGSALNQLLQDNLPQQVGVQATVITPVHKQGTEVDAQLYTKLDNGRFQLTEHIHLNTDLTPKQVP